jgi:hypothetical protein
MKNLQSFGVQEMDVQDRKNINGGGFGVSWFVGAIVGNFLYAVVEDWEGNVAAFNSARNR